MKLKKEAFTLVELIVVITILAILGTIAFISLQGYSKDARDSVRITDLKNIEKSLELFITKEGKLIKPENSIEVTASGILIGYQGYAGKKVLNTIGINGGGKDPLDDTYYTYYVNSKLTKYQLLGFLENTELGFKNSANNIYASLEKRSLYTKGNQLGILVNEATNEPAQINLGNIDVVTTTTGYKVKLSNSKNGEKTGTGNILSVELAHRINEKGSCDAILKNGRSTGNKIYNIDPEKDGVGFNVYCDMSKGGEGWTALFSVKSSSKIWSYNSTEWETPTLRGEDFINEETTYNSYSKLNTRKIKMCRIDNGKCYIFNHNLNIPLQKFYTDDITFIDYSRFYYSDNYPADDSRNTNYPENIGNDNAELFFSSLNIYKGSFSNYFTKFGLGINITSNNKIGFQADSNNRWPTVDNIIIGIGSYAKWPFMPNSCSYTRPIPNDLFKSITTRVNACHYDDLVHEMWYVYGM